MLKGSVDEITPPLSPATMNLLMAIGQNHQLTQLMIQLQKMPELHRTEMLTTYNSGHMNVINTIFNALPTLFNTFKFDKKNMKILIMGLPGSGKTYLAARLQPLLKAAWYNADNVREMANDWDFSEEGRKRQAKRMAKVYQSPVG